MSASASASIHWWGMRLRAAYSRSAIEAGVNCEPMIRSVSAAADMSTARRARNASSTVSLRRTSVSDPGAEDVGGDHDDLAGLDDPRREVRALAGDEADLAEEAAGAVGRDDGAVRARSPRRRR